MCDKAVRDDPSSLQFVPDCFVTMEGVDMWHDDYYDDEGDHWEDDNNEDNFLNGTKVIKNGKLKKPQ